MSKDRVRELENLCCELYQIVGVIDFEIEADELIPVLDNLSDAMCGDELRHKTLLPFTLEIK